MIVYTLQEFIDIYHKGSKPSCARFFGREPKNFYVLLTSETTYEVIVNKGIAKLVIVKCSEEI